MSIDDEDGSININPYNIIESITIVIIEDGGGMKRGRSGRGGEEERGGGEVMSIV